jgi:hypothetical protein
MKYLLTTVFGAMAAMAGPPLICHPIDIGAAKSLPWKTGTMWNGADPHYDSNELVTDTLSILTPKAPLELRMETLRRAAIYSGKNELASAKLTARLVARIADGSTEANAWFDAGYFVECLRQLSFVYKYDMLPAAEKSQWKMPNGGTGLDGRPWIEKAMQLGGKGMGVALGRVDEWRKADLKASAKWVKPRSCPP